MANEYKTLRELDVKPGDVVVNYLRGAGTIVVDKVEGGAFYSESMRMSHAPIWRIVSRASENPQTYTPGERQAVATYPRASVSPDHAWEVDDTPKPIRDMTDAEIGALVRANNEGKVIESICSEVDSEWDVVVYPAWFQNKSYRVRPEPKRETVESCGSVDRDQDGKPHFFHYPVEAQTHRITFDLIDGNPDCDSIKMEEM
jgi:hypothetical protein